MQKRSAANLIQRVRPTPYAAPEGSTEQQTKTKQKQEKMLAKYRVLTLENRIPKLDPEALETLSRRHIESQYEYWTDKSPWRPCGWHRPDLPGHACIGSHYGPGGPLHEFVYPVEVVEQKCASEEPRPCIACILFYTSMLTLPHNRSMVQAIHEDTQRPCTIQYFAVIPEEWQKDLLLLPGNANGVPNGIIKPFLRFNEKMVCVLSERSGTFILQNEPLDQTVPIETALSLMIPDLPPFTPIRNLDELTQRLEFVEAKFKYYRRLPPSPLRDMITFYWGLYTDSLVPLYLRRHIPTAYSKPEYQPSNVFVLSQLTLPEMPHIDLGSATDPDPLALLYKKAITLFKSRKSNIGEIADQFQTVTRDCAWVSALGNYYHAKFSHPDHLTNIGDRIKAMHKANSLTKSHLAIIMAEFIAARMPVYPFWAAPDMSWFDFVQHAISDANHAIRGCPAVEGLNPIRPVPLVTYNDVSYMTLDMPTGHCETYICLKCKGITAPVAQRPRGFKKLTLVIDPAGPSMSEAPKMFCIACPDSELIFFDLHGAFWCLGNRYWMVACPDCDLVNAHTANEPLTTTRCHECEAKALGLNRHCFMDKKRIAHDDIHQQVVIIASENKAEFMDCCGRHARDNPYVIQTR